MWGAFGVRIRAPKHHTERRKALRECTADRTEADDARDLSEQGGRDVIRAKFVIPDRGQRPIESSRCADHQHDAELRDGGGIPRLVRRSKRHPHAGSRRRVHVDALVSGTCRHYEEEFRLTGYGILVERIRNDHHVEIVRRCTIALVPIHNVVSRESLS